MNYKEVSDLIKLVNKSDLTEFRLKDKEFEILIRTDKYQKKSNVVTTAAPSVISVPASPSPAETPQSTPTPAPTAAPKVEHQEAVSEENKNLLEVKSPIVGTFYRSPSPDKGPFVKVGDKINAGDVVCIVEAMKLFNEIESEISGTIVKVLVEDAAPVEYDQALFLVDPS